MNNEHNSYPRVLIVAHEVINLTTSVGKTLHQYFEGWPVDKLSEIYFHSEVPTTHLCEQYFRITDFDVVKSLNPAYKPGQTFGKEDINEALLSARVDKGFQNRIYQKGKEKKDWMFFGRNFLWGLNTWKTNKLDQWIKKVDPQVIFFPTSDYVFPYKIVEYLSKRYALPVVVCVYDDYFYGQTNKDTLLNRYNQWVLNKHTKQVFNNAAYALYNQPKMAELYKRDFDLPSDVFYVSAEPSDKEEVSREDPVISYFGSLGLGRIDSIIEIGKAIDELNAGAGTHIDIYSAEDNEAVIDKINKAPRLQFKGKISSKEVLEKVDDSNVLLLPESFDPQYLGRIEFALSTKVPEYLASNRCILAYGPENCGTVGYLLAHGIGCVATNYDKLKGLLSEVLTSCAKRKEYADGQMALAKRNHSHIRNHNALKNAFLTACEERD